MSSYLSVYGKFKGSEKKHLLYTVTRSSDFYQQLHDELSLKFCNEEIVYNEVSSVDLLRVLNSVKTEIDSCEKRLSEYEKYAASNSTYIDEIVSLKEYRESLYVVYNEVNLFFNMLDSNECMSEMEKLFVTID